MLYLTPPEDLGSLFPDEPPYRARQLTEWLYRAPVATLDEMTNLPKRLRDELAGRLWPFEVETAQSADRGMTVKWLFRAPDGGAIEAVLMGYSDRATLCISSQVGCAMACTFCATGQFGFERHLVAGEIFAQVAFAQAFLRGGGMPGAPDHLTNIVFMGMGEPLANYGNVRESIRRMVEVMGLSARAITVSTVGVVPGIRRLTEDEWPVNLAVSLHAADDDLRSRLVPLNRRYPLADVVEAAADYFLAKGRRISIEWTLIAGVNDGAEQAAGLADIALDLRAHVNVIALNPTPLSEDQPPARAAVDDFVAALRRAGTNVTLRDTRGQDIDAACGQLRVRAAQASPGGQGADAAAATSAAAESGRP